MEFIHVVLNLVGIVLCLRCQAGRRRRPETFTGPSLLISTIRRTDTVPKGGWSNLVGLAALLTLRPLFYWHIGSELNWTPALHMGPFALHFRSDFIGRMFIYSWLGFAGAMGWVVSWLLFFSILNHRPSDPDPFQSFIQRQWGFLSGTPVAVKILFPCLAGCLVWPALRAGLTALEMIPEAVGPTMIVKESLIVSGSFYLLWKLPASILLILHVVNSYVYLGNHSFWHILQQSAKSLLKPIRWLPLRIGKVDLAPILALPMVFLVAEIIELGMTRLFEDLIYL